MGGRVAWRDHVFARAGILRKNLLKLERQSAPLAESERSYAEVQNGSQRLSFLGLALSQSAPLVSRLSVSQARSAVGSGTRSANGSRSAEQRNFWNLDLGRRQSALLLVFGNWQQFGQFQFDIKVLTFNLSL
ncbi:hypothetical protein Adt_39461 [Abeliophyllum distichum]|uniref:Uncharacterized protein n=1 Tax=Abeliophyllum distichum TaxID=126358 RepID=A0ABD1Q5D3_9LAMI